MKRKLLGIFAGVIITSSLLMVAVQASSYDTWFSFDSNVRGETRSFDGQNIGFSATAVSSPFVHTFNKTYSVKLKRSNFFTDDTIGIVTMNRDTKSTAKWTNVGSGNYYVELSKAVDGVTLTAGSSSNPTVSFYNY
ncbi:MAG: hypothetical protein N3I35_17440 [Clostridia bacterium]|nr:hypothetical protein [Clostridia bacterium]